LVRLRHPAHGLGGCEELVVRPHNVQKFADFLNEFLRELRVRKVGRRASHRKEP
jgi:hypothetical protein